MNESQGQLEKCNSRLSDDNLSRIYSQTNSHFLTFFFTNIFDFFTYRNFYKKKYFPFLNRRNMKYLKFLVKRRKTQETYHWKRLIGNRVKFFIAFLMDKLSSLIRIVIIRPR